MNAQSQLPHQTSNHEVIARRLRLSGHVQGVGFRPFVYRLARELDLCGTVQNLRGDVEIVAQGSDDTVSRFIHDLISLAPVVAAPHITENQPTEVTSRGSFEILGSDPAANALIYVPPDFSTCAQCLTELMDPGDRRYRYPFINCTQCGPRYTLIRSLPYDRANTTMATFPLCPACLAEYSSPADRRFHAEPVACSACGPTLWLEEGGAGPIYAHEALAGAVAILRRGGIVALKGIGGYHLLCDASDPVAIGHLRSRKHRPQKPLAVMFPQTGIDGLDSVRREVQVSRDEATLLTSAARPIVLLRRQPSSSLPAAIAPGLDEIGAFLPYSPLHHLLLADFGRPLVATSGNVSGEPVLTLPEEVKTRLAGIADAGLHHDRPIARPVDDSVTRVVLGDACTIRLGRGLAPLERELPWSLQQPVLAVGGHLKTTVALAWDNRVVMSPHIADMGSTRSEDVFAQVAEDLQLLYGKRAMVVVCDAHPNYATTHWADRSGLPVTRVLHHHAHASALAAEHLLEERTLVFAWDGVGFGADGTLWGGETFLGQAGRWERVASMRPFRVPGGESAGRAPWRSAAAVCWETGQEVTGLNIDPLARAAWRRNLNCPQMSSAGRLFDAVAALVLNVRETSYEAQGPMLLEKAAASVSGRDQHAASLPLYRDPLGLMRADWAPLLKHMLNTVRSAASRAAYFHSTMAATIVAIAEKQRAATGVNSVGLTGGVFQNVQLVERAHWLLTCAGFSIRLAHDVPCNDGGISYGQVAEFAARQHLDTRT